MVKTNSGDLSPEEEEGKGISSSSLLQNQQPSTTTIESPDNNLSSSSSSSNSKEVITKEEVLPLSLIRETLDFKNNKEKAFTITLSLDENNIEETEFTTADESVTGTGVINNIGKGGSSSSSSSSSRSGRSKSEKKKKAKKNKVFVMRCSTFKVEIICDENFGGLIGK